MADRRNGPRDGHSSGTPVTGRLARPTRTIGPGNRPGRPRPPASSLFGLAPGGVYHAVPVAGDAVGSYPTLSPLPARPKPAGGLLSVALSLGSPPPGVTRHRVSMEPGLSSPASFRPVPERPSGRLVVLIKAAFRPPSRGQAKRPPRQRTARPISSTRPISSSRTPTPASISASFGMAKPSTSPLLASPSR